MFVFPAFNSNYKTRKRTFKCCQNCRVKRIKCEITSSNYESEGCTNCLRNNLKCNLIKDKMKDTPIDGSTTTPNGPSSDLEKVFSPFDKADLESYMVSDVTKIDAKFLKKGFNFNICSDDKALTYQYVFHNHPKYIISNRLDDNSIWHESGVIVDNKPDDMYKPYKTKASLSNDQFHLKSLKVYNFLLSINAFSISSPEFPINEFEIAELVNLYFRKLNNIFPVINEMEFRKDFENGNAPTVLLNAIILVFSRDALAEPILLNIFKRGNPELEFTKEQFSTTFSDYITDLDYKIRQLMLILPQLGDCDKLTRLEVSLLLSLHFNFDKMGHEQSSHDLTDAINLAESLAIHMKRVKENESKRSAASNLWWCCYVFDRFNAMVCSRQCFINSADFNIDLPSDNIHLLKMVQLARSLENMYSIYQPFKNSVIDSEGIKIYNKFNFDEFQRIEFLFCNSEREGNSKLEYNPAGNQFEYSNKLVHFISRIVSNFIIIGSQKSKYDNSNYDNSIPDYNAARAAANILWYHTKMRSEDLINIPLVPFILSVSMAVCLKMITKKYINNAKTLYESDDIQTFEKYIHEFERYVNKWTVFDELCSLSKNYVYKIASNSQLIKETKIKIQSSEVDLKGYYNNPFSETNSNIPKIESLQSIKNIIREPEDKLNSKKAVNRTGGNVIYETNTENSYNEYFDSLQVDIFDNDLFRDFPNMVNFLD